MFWRYIFPIFAIVAMLTIFGGLIVVYQFFGMIAFWIGIGAVILLCLWVERRAPYSPIPEPEPMSGWFADDRPHLTPPVEQAKLGRASEALTNRREGGTPTRHHRRG